MSTNFKKKAFTRQALLRLSLAAAGAALLDTSAVAGCCEEGTKELLAEHIEFYPSPTTDLPGCTDTTDNLVTEFADAGGWSRTWWANADAWESDWKRTSLAGGDDASWSDANDFSYFCGHGNVGFVSFTTNNTDTRLRETDVGYGDVDVEWVTFDSSKTLERQAGAAELDTWYSNAFTGGLHLLIGWHDSPLDGDTGGEFADEMIDHSWLDGGGSKIKDAWFDGDGGCTDQDDDTTQMIIAENLGHYDDFLHGQGGLGASDASPDGNYWMWSHDC